MKLILVVRNKIYTLFIKHFSCIDTPPSIEKPYGPYPLYVTNVKHKAVPILQAYANSKYVGKVVLKFDSNGDLINTDGSPTLLNHEIQQGYNSIFVYIHI